ncbi:metallophosphoesterase [Caproiciproducens sp. MSJ-32]|uniref:metallophosphoesterase n=1 Tax=Caproiciproducens sp. MSJ-32 TaxID=2841527 RepID=UPI002ED6984A
MLYAAAALPIIILIRYIIGEDKFDFFAYKGFYFYAIIIFFALYAILALTGTLNASFSKIKSYEIVVNKHLNKPINIVMVSDIHLGNIIRNKRLKKMVQIINSLNPDIIAIAGDIVDSNITPFTERNMAEEFSHLKSVDYGHLQKDNFNVIVSSGYGTWGPPIRLGSKSEIVLIKLKGK